MRRLCGCPLWCHNSEGLFDKRSTEKQRSQGPRVPPFHSLLHPGVCLQTLEGRKGSGFVFRSREFGLDIQMASPDSDSLAL